MIYLMWTDCFRFGSCTGQPISYRRLYPRRRGRPITRLESALYRAYYDAYTRARLITQTAQEEHALDALREAQRSGSATALLAAKAALAQVPASDLRARIFELADELFHNVGLQLSVSKYGASGIERGANLDRVDVDLNDRAWMMRKFADIEKMKSEEEKLASIAAIVNYTNPGPGGFYDDLGDPSHEPHLVLGHGWKGDPQLYETTINGIADMIPNDNLRVSWINYAETLYDTPLDTESELGVAAEKALEWTRREERNLAMARVLNSPEMKSCLDSIASGEGLKEATRQYAALMSKTFV